MDTAIIGAVSAVLGTLVGGSATVTTAYITQKTVNRRELIQTEIRKRESLYGDFIAECSKLIVDSYTHTLDKPETLLPLYALTNRIRLCATHPVLVEAERLLKRITGQYFAANLTVEQVRELALSEDADPLDAFGEACRVELRGMSARL